MTSLPIVFAPGLMCDGRLFEKQASCFQCDRDVHVADFSQGESIEEYADGLLKAAPSQFFLSGLSMGGIVAFEVWRQAPGRIVGLGLLNTTPFADSPARTKVRLSQIERVRGGELKTVVMEELKPNYLGAKTKQDKAVLDNIYAMAETLGADVFIRQSQALMTRADSVKTLPVISCPTAIICGVEDKVCPPELHTIMNDGIAHSTLDILAGCGHLSTIEAAPDVNRILAKALTTAEGAIG